MLDYRQLFDTSANAYMVVDRELRFVDANVAYLRITGATKEQLVGRSLFDVFPDPNEAVLRGSFDRVLKTRKTDVLAHIPYRVPRVAGGEPEERVWSATHTPILDERGEVAFIMQHTQDVTRVQGAVEASTVVERAGQVQQELATLRALFDQAPGFIAFLSGPEHRFDLINRAYQRLIGGRDATGKTLREALPEIEGQGYSELLDRVYETGEAFVGSAAKVELARQSDGRLETRYLDFVYQPIRGLDGRTRGIFVQGHDVTESTAAIARERFIARATEITANDGDDIEETLRRVARTAVEGYADVAFIDVFDAQGSRRIAVAHADPTKTAAAAQLAKFPSPRTLPAQHAFPDIATGARLIEDMTEQMIVDSTRGPEHAQALRDLDFRSVATVPVWHAGELFAVIVVASATRRLGPADLDVMVELGRIATIALDHARLSRERAQLLASEQDARERAEAANRAKDEFLAMLGHELRNPLAPILTAVQLMRLRGETSSAREQSIIERQAHHLVRLLDDLLDVARIARGKIQLEKADIEIALAAAKAVEIASPLLDTKGHQLSIDIPAHGLRVHGDEARLSQVIANLLTNAARYTDAGGQITLSAVRAGDEVVIKVRDNGMGISPEMLPKIFELFVQAPQAPDRSTGGLGLGLTLVRRLVEMHGGTVAATSAGLGHGTELVVRLPALPAEPAPPPVAPSPKADHAGARKILIVDDNEDAAFLLSDLLARRGHEVHVEHDGLAGFQRAVDVRPDLAVIDIGLPSIDGYEVARRLHATLGQDAPRMIALTGYGGPTERAKSRESGFLAHLTKPIELSRLLELIDRPTIRMI